MYCSTIRRSNSFIPSTSLSSAQFAVPLQVLLLPALLALGSLLLRLFQCLGRLGSVRIGLDPIGQFGKCCHHDAKGRRLEITGMQRTGLEIGLHVSLGGVRDVAAVLLRSGYGNCTAAKGKRHLDRRAEIGIARLAEGLLHLGLAVDLGIIQQEVFVVLRLVRIAFLGLLQRQRGTFHDHRAGRCHTPQLLVEVATNQRVDGGALGPPGRQGHAGRFQPHDVGN
mmetsp:Transcript_13495/g.38607  ORF Transcript_13495/g.38607 Transcript_13495/m.38607 type:complete len:224 (-) Transcript_13495:1986-2657(-)